MLNGDRRDPRERGSTDQSLRTERHETDRELENTARSIRDTATNLVTEARDKADTVLDAARAREDLRTADDHTEADRDALVDARAREDEVLDEARSTADIVASDDRRKRQVALARLLAFERDDTDLKLEIERTRADALLSSREDFMAMVSHDLRSLLGGIALSAELLRDVELVADPFVKVKHYAERIQRFTARMNRIVGDLMDVASIEAGKLSLLRSRCNSAQLLRDALEAFEPAAALQGIALSAATKGEPGDVDVDHERILQVLTNLVGNALKFTPRGGRITLLLERGVDSVTFAVADTGEGIRSGQTTKIFDRYFQSSDVDRRGLGLGLFIAKSIVEGHGGKIWVESTPDVGSTFFFTVPARGSGESARAAP